MIYLVDNNPGNSLSKLLMARLGAKLATRTIIAAEATSKDTSIIIATLNNAAGVIEWQRFFGNLGLPLTFLSVFEDEVLIGPTFTGDKQGCISCLKRRYFGGRTAARRFADLSSSHPSSEDVSSLTLPLMEITAQVLAHWIRHELGSDRNTACGRKLISFNLRSFSIRQSELIPDPNCAECSVVPMDTSVRAHIKLSPRPKKDRKSDRTQSVKNLEHVQTLYVGERTKLVPSEGVRWPIKRGAVVTVEVPISKDRPSEPCSGFSPRYSDASTTAVLEGLERYAGVRPRAYTPSIRDSRSQLYAYAPDPRSFGLHDLDSYQRNPHLLTPYTDDLRLSFIWAHSFSRNAPVLLPQQLCYYSLAVEDEPIFVVEGSLGCALGSCAEESILHGIFEVIERDAFLMTWYAKMCPPRLDPAEWTDPEIRFYVRALDADGFDVYAFDVTNDLGVSAVWLTARRRDDRMPNSISLSAAHLVPEKAVQKAFRELIGMLCRYEIELNSPKIQQRVRSLAESPSTVRTMMDHALLYCSPISTPSLDFLFAGTSKRSLKDMEEKSREILSNDLAEDVRRIIDRVTAAGCDVFSVDQTTPELLMSGLCTFKTLIAGAIPMSWGEHLRRTSGLARLDNAIRLNSPARDTSAINEINDAPHPFP